MVGAGDCFLIETDRYEDGSIRSHLHVIVIDCEEHTGTTIIVVVETLTSKKDTTVVLRQGDHEFIKQDSYVNYRRAKTTSNTDIEHLVKRGKARPMGSIKGDLLKRIEQGLKASVFTPQYVVDFYAQFRDRKMK